MGFIGFSSAGASRAGWKTSKNGQANLILDSHA